MWFTSYLDLTLFSLLQVSHLRESLVSYYGWLSAVLACVFAVLTCNTYLLVAFTVVYRMQMSLRLDPRFNNRWGALFMPFAQSDNIAIPAFYSLFVIRRFALAVTAILLPNYTLLFALLNSSLAVFNVLYLLLAHPYAGRLDQIEAVTAEIGTTWVFLLVSAFVFPLNSNIQRILGEVGTWSLRVVVAANSLFAVLKSGLAVIEVVKEYQAKVKKAKYHIKWPERRWL